MIKVRSRRTIVGIAAGAVVAAGLLVGAPAQAGPPGTWTGLSTSTYLSSINTPSVTRIGASLLVVWSQDDGPSKESIRSRIVSPSGKSVGPISTVVSGWSTIINDPKVIKVGRTFYVFFAGLHSGVTEDPLNGPMVFATSTDGRTWTPPALDGSTGSASKSGGAYGSYGTAVAYTRNGFFTAWTNGSSDRVSYHQGLDMGSTPATSDDFALSGKAGGNVLHTALAVDPATNKLWSAWYVLGRAAGRTTTSGVYVQEVDPTRTTTAAKAPGSSTGINSLIPDQAVALAATPTRGVWAAYVLGYPTATKVRVWKVGTSTYLDIPAPGASRVTLVRSTAGRLWALWASGDRLYFSRSNSTMTAFGRVGSVPAVRFGGTSGSTYHVAADGSTGPLDVIVNANHGAASYSTMVHQQVFASLTVKVSPASVSGVRGGSVTVKVTDAGEALAGVTVRLLGRTAVTNGLGVAVLRVPARTPAGRKTVSASRTAYATGSAVVVVR